MVIYERSETYVHYITLRDRDGTLTDPSSVSLTITSPCDTVLLDEGSMASLSSGVYYCNYDLLSTAIYGEYSALVTATDAGVVSKFTEKFYVMPWNIIDEIRTYSQQGVKKISDDDLSLIAWNAFKEVMHRVGEYHRHERLCRCVDGVCQCDSSAECACGCCGVSPICSDGYQLDHTPIMDFNMDGNVHGCECDDASDECHNDICGIWIDNEGTCSNISVQIVSAVCGHIKVFQADCVTAIPVSNQGIFVNYHSTWQSFDSQIFKKAVVYLASYEVAIITNLSSKKVSGCDERGRVSFTQRLWDRYITLIEGISKPNFAGGR